MCLKKQPKNVCLITESTENLTVLSLAKILSNLNCKVDVIAFNNPQNNFQTIDDCNFDIHVIGYKKNQTSGKKVKRITKYLQSIQNAKHLKNKMTEIGGNFDLIVSNMYLANITCKRLNMPNTYYCIHSVLSSVIANYYDHKWNLFSFAQKKIYLFLVGKLYKDQNLITVSDGIKKDLANLGIQSKSVQTIYNPIDFDEIREKSDQYPIEEKNYIIHIGRFSKEKRHDVLIKAYKKSNVSQKLLLLGDENNDIGEQTKQLVKDLELEGKVIFKGFKSNPFPYIKSAKALILSSDHEGFGMVLAEALILKTPVVSTDCTGPNEILSNELKSFLSPVRDIDALAKNIKRIVSNPVKIHKKHFDKFNAEKSVKQYLALCN